MQDRVERRLYVKPYDRMVGDVVLEISKGNIILDPDYQRNYVWKNKKASLLIESILLNIPIPVLYASEDEEGRWIIVDGLQRLYSLKRFFDGDFKLTGLETLSSLNGKKFTSLDADIQTKITRGELRFIVLQNDSDPNIQFDIFMRLNTGAVTLNEQELRNCLYRGSLNEMIKDFVKNNEYAVKMINVNPTRMFANELTLRYLALSENYNKSNNKITNYDGRMKNVINSYMKKHQNDDDTKLHEIRTQLESNFEKAYAIFGENAFSNNHVSSKTKASLSECTLIAVEDYPLDLLKSNVVLLNKGREALLNDKAFLNAIDKGTGNKDNVEYRIKEFYNMVKGVMDNGIKR